LVKIDNINQVYAHFEDVVKDSVKQTYKDWIKNHYAKLWHLQSILDELKVYLPSNGDDHNLPEELWAEVKKKIEKIITWTDSIKYTSESLSLKSLSNTWQKGFNDVQFNLPEKLKLEIRPALYKIQSEDKNGFKLRKKTYRFIKNLPVNIYGSKTNIRIIELHNFLTHYLEVPVTKLILTLWQEHLKEISIQYKKIFDKISELKEKILFLEELEKLQDPFEKIEFFEKIYTIAEILNQTDIVLQSLHEQNDHINNFVEEEWQKISEIIEFCWQYAGTYILPNRKYRQEVLSYNKKIAEKNFRKIVHFWQENFEVLRTTWLKNLQIYLLQIKTVEELRNHSKELTEKCEVVLNPAFEQVLSLIHNEEEKYQSKQKPSLFKNKINTTHSEFFKKLQNQILPNITESLHQTCITESLENYKQNIESHFIKIPDHIILSRFHANGAIHPKSKKIKIDLKKLIQKEFLQTYGTANSSQIDETKQRLKSIVSSISEIRTVFDLNLKSAENLLNNSKDSSALDEAFTVLRTSFRRSREIVQSSWQNSKESVDYAKEILLANAIQLYKDFQGFINTEQLIEYQLKLKRDKSQIYLKELFTKSFRYLSTFFTKFFRGALSKIQSLVKKESKNTLQNLENILHKQNQIIHQNLAQTPNVYQRLFAAGHEPENDFYMQRETIEQQINQFYLNWQDNKNTTCVIMGDNGLGKSSILNFFENIFSKEKPVYRIKLFSRCSSESDLSTIFETALKTKNMTSLNLLQEALVNLDQSPIILVDNLHYLTFNSVDGLELLEKFLLLVQNTRDNIFWIFTCIKDQWLIYDNILYISEVINEQINLPGFSKNEIKNIILERHKLSGHQISYEATEQDKHSGKFKRLQAENRHQQYLEDRFFKRLYASSAGNITIALKYWLASIISFNEDNFVLQPLPAISSHIFEQFKEDDIFVLLSFMKQGFMTAEECSQFNRVLPHQNNLILTRLLHLGLLEKVNKYYRLNVMYQPILKEFMIAQNLWTDKLQKSSTGKNNQVKIQLYFPVHIDTLHIKNIAKRIVGLSKFTDLSQDVFVHITNKIFDGVSMYIVQIDATILHHKYEQKFCSEVTETIFSQLLKQGIISEQDFLTKN
jgi:hypothetical protein